MVKNTESTRGPVFVLGMNGSGTTMLLDCLGRHPELYGFPRETRVFPGLLARDFGDLSDDRNFERAFDAVRRVPAFMQMNGDRILPLPDNWKEVDRSVASVIDACMAHFAGERRWIEKSPQHALHINTLIRAWPDARVIHVVRDGRRCAASFRRRWGRNPVFTAYRWRQLVEQCSRDGKALSPASYLQVRYEDLTRAPDQWMQAICSFLDVPFDPAVLVSEFPQSDREGELGGIVVTEKPIDLPARILKQIDKVAGRTLDRNGYPTSNPEGEHNPGKIKLYYWLATDYLRQYTGEITSKIRGRNRKSWATIARLPVTALSQTLSRGSLR